VRRTYRCVRNTALQLLSIIARVHMQETPCLCEQRCLTIPVCSCVCRAVLWICCSLRSIGSGIIRVYLIVVRV
jgi:hypothetical protein